MAEQLVYRVAVALVELEAAIEKVDRFLGNLMIGRIWRLLLFALDVHLEQNVLIRKRMPWPLARKHFYSIMYTTILIKETDSSQQYTQLSSFVLLPITTQPRLQMSAE